MADSNAQKKTTSSLDVNTFNNTEYGQLRYGYYGDNMGFISMSPVFPAYKGKQPEKGSKPYNHEEKIFFSLNLGDIERIEDGLKKLEKGDIKDFDVVHKGKVLSFAKSDDGVPGVMLSLVNEENTVTRQVEYFFDNAEDDSFIFVDLNEGGKKVYVNIEYKAIKKFLVGSLSRYINKEFRVEFRYGDGSGAAAGGADGAPRRSFASNSGPSANGNQRRGTVSPRNQQVSGREVGNIFSEDETEE